VSNTASPAFINNAAVAASISTSRSTKLNMMPAIADTSMLDSGFLLAASHVSQHIANSPKDEALLLTDTAHLSLELLSFYFPSTLMLKFVALMGQVVNMSCSSYMCQQDGGMSMASSDVMSNAVMLATSLAVFAKGALPNIEAVLLTPTHQQDTMAYDSIFKPAGVSWVDFKTLQSEGVLEWVHVDADETVNGEDSLMLQPSSSADEHDTHSQQYMYWLYDGQVEVCGGSEVLLSADTDRDMMMSDKAFWSTYKAGEQGATLLRLNTGIVAGLNMRKMSGDDSKVKMSLQRLMMKNLRSRMAHAASAM
jgi:hypothetical protein